jgi:Amt family ammonium transporter
MGRKLWGRLLALAIAAMLLAIFGSSVIPATVVAADPPTIDSMATNTQSLQISVDTVWVLLTGFLVFFMQTGFAILEAGLVRQISVVNTLLENFIDAGVTALAFWASGFAIAFGTSAWGLFGTDNFFLSNAVSFSDGNIIYAMGAPGSAVGISTFALFFFQFAFAATASTITTGAMAERTDFVGDLIYATIMGAFSYPIIVHWVWNSGGWLNKLGYMDFAGSSVVHTVGGWTAIVGAYLLGPRPNRVWGEIPAPHNLSLATLGTMILWFGWYGFNPGSTLGTANHGLIGLITINTTLAGAAGGISAMLYVFFRTVKWNLFCTLNGSLAGLVAVTAGCAFIAPWASVVIGLVAGVLVIVVVDFIESLEIDDPVGAFAVHGSCGMMGTIAVGLFGLPELTVNKKAGLFLGGGFDLLMVQILGVLAITTFTAIFAFVMFTALNLFGRLRMHPDADKAGIDVYEHGASAWPDVYPIDDLVSGLDDDD